MNIFYVFLCQSEEAVTIIITIFWVITAKTKAFVKFILKVVVEFLE